MCRLSLCLPYSAPNCPIPPFKKDQAVLPVIIHVFFIRLKIVPDQSLTASVRKDIKC